MKQKAKKRKKQNQKLILRKITLDKILTRPIKETKEKMQMKLMMKKGQ